MLEALGELATFSFKTLVIVVAIAMILGLLSSLRRGRTEATGKIRLVNLGKELAEQELHLLEECGDKSVVKKHKRMLKKQQKRHKKTPSRRVTQEIATSSTLPDPKQALSTKTDDLTQQQTSHTSESGIGESTIVANASSNQVQRDTQNEPKQHNANQADTPPSNQTIQHKQTKDAHSTEEISTKAQDAISYVISFHGDIRASENVQLAKKVTALLQLCRPEQDEIIVQLESAGGMVHAYGLAAAQLKRLVDAKLRVVVCVDKVAASGGYMMACIASHIVAAPFALVGSIGVVAQLPNIHKLLNKWQIDVELHTAGKYKRTLTTLGKNTPEARRKFQEDLERTHGLFQSMVANHRPQLDMQQIATGEVWFGREALDMSLIDELALSDEYIFRRWKEKRQIYQVEYKERKKITSRISNAASVFVDGVIMRVLQREYEQQITSGNSK